MRNRGLVNPLVMEFDHLPGTVKVMNLGDGGARRLGREKLMEEIAKCVVRCANCHRMRTAVTLWGKTLPDLEGFGPDVSD